MRSKLFILFFATMGLMGILDCAIAEPLTQSLTVHAEHAHEKGEGSAHAEDVCCAVHHNWAPPETLSFFEHLIRSARFLSKNFIADLTVRPRIIFHPPLVF